MKLTTEQSKWNLIKIVTLLAFIGICYKFYTIVRFSYSDVQWRGRYDLLTFLMPIVCLGVFIDIIRQKTLRGFFAISFVYISYAVFITIASCGYPLFNLPFAIVNMTYWYVVCYAFYRFFKNYDQTKKMDWLIKLTLVLFYICAVAYFISLGEANELAYYEKRDVLANTSYYLICLFPIVLLTPSKTIRVITTILLSVIVVFSNKRAGFIVMAVCLACVFFIDSSSKKNNAKYLRFIILAIVTVFLTFFIVDKFELHIFDRFESFTSGEDGGSGRGNIWNETIEVLKHDNFIKNVFGRGYRAVSVDSHYSGVGEAHNDVLQALVDYGIPGVIALFGIYYYLIIVAFKMKKYKYIHRTPYVVSLVIFFGFSMASMMLIYPYWFLGIAMFWGYIYADFEKYLKCIKEEEMINETI